MARAYQSGLQSATATIANGASLSGATDLQGCTLVGIATPAAWTAAAISFQVDLGDGTFRPFASVPDNAEITIPSALIPTGAAWQFALNPALFAGVRQVKVQSGTSAANVAQGAQRLVTLIYRML